MTDPQVSPISQLLHTLGITREDLMKHSDQMRQFLTANDDLCSRVFERDNSAKPHSGQDSQSKSKPASSSRSLARSLSLASSSSLRDGTPPSTPVKSEQQEVIFPHRRMDSMEMVIERQRRRRKNRKGRERESSRNQPHPPSPCPSNTSHSSQSINSVIHARDELKASSPNTVEGAQNDYTEKFASPEVPPVTPQKNRYYRDHTNLSTHSQKDDTHKAETPTPTRLVTQAVPQSQVPPQYYAYPAYMGYPHCLPMPYRALQAGACQIPVTPQAQRVLAAPTFFPNKFIGTPLPLSPPVSSPMSSPARRIVNLVSSPGPMGPGPQENDYDDLPYTLPPGPYLTTKPDLSYAALIGRAILSSSEHRLTLQEIYDWITIVYPYYKRGETTWMNSIRHVLSTTIVFRKVPRDRSVGRTLWAIYDEDLECFKDGGFKKHLCKDYANGNDSKGKGKGKARRRTDDDDGDRKTKRARKEPTTAGASAESAVVHSSFLAHNSLGLHPLFPGTGPTPHLQPYYQHCMPQPPSLTTVPAGVIFPPLPASAALSRIIGSTADSSSSVSRTEDVSSIESSASPSITLSHSSPAPEVISSSVPELTPSRNSSSPPSSMPATSDIDVDMHVFRSTRTTNGASRAFASPFVADAQDKQADCPSSADVDDDAIFNTNLLSLVKFWQNSPKQSATLQPGSCLPTFGDSDDETFSDRRRKGKKRAIVRLSKGSAFPVVTTSPTLNLRTVRPRLDDNGRPTTPVSSTTPPSTPPRSTHKISSIRTPISHKGIHMSPSTSLAHYKSNLDPPPTVSGGVAPLDVSQNITFAEDEAADTMKTPRKRTSIANAPSIFGHPVTPKKLIFSSGMTDSPFRTPRSRAMLDPHDPGVLLNDELNRMAYDDSPAGLFGKERSSLLYDSPGLEGYKWW